MDRATAIEFDVKANLGLEGGVSADELRLVETCLDELFQQVTRRMALEGEE